MRAIKYSFPSNANHNFVQQNVYLLRERCGIKRREENTHCGWWDLCICIIIMTMSMNYYHLSFSWQHTYAYYLGACGTDHFHRIDGRQLRIGLLLINDIRERSLDGFILLVFRVCAYVMP